MVIKKESAPKKKVAVPKASESKSESKKVAPKMVVEQPSAIQRRRTVLGTVVSNKMQKTIVVEVERQVRHKLYGKYVKRLQRYKAHDETNVAKIGDVVSLIESRPLSKDKRWALYKILRKASAAASIEAAV